MKLQARRTKDPIHRTGLLPTLSNLLCAKGTGASSLRFLALAAFAMAAFAAGDANQASAAEPETCPNATLRSENRSTYLPDCRAYEMVSPPYKEGHTLVTRNLSRSGSAVIAQSFGAFAGTEDDPKGNGLLAASYEFNRGTGGWTASAITPPASEFAEDFSGNAPQLVSGDFGTTTWVLNTYAQPPLARDLYLRNPAGKFVRVGPLTPPAATDPDDNSLIGASNDLSHVAFLLSKNRWPRDTTERGASSLYESVAGASSEEPKLIGVTNSGVLAANAEADLVSECGTHLGDSDNQEEAESAISSDGETIYFTALPCASGPPVAELYARVNQSTTVAISEPPFSVPGRLCTGLCKESEEDPTLRREGVFVGASEDGSRVLFTTEQPLVDSDSDETNDLYEEVLAQGKIESITQVSRGNSSDPSPGFGANVLSAGPVAASGAHVYFVAEGVLTGSNPEGMAPVAGEPNFYSYDTASGSTVFIAGLAFGASEGARTTPNGQWLVYGDEGRLFEYDSLTGTLTAIASQGEEPSVSDDGAFVAFSTTAALTPRASNDASAEKIYEFHSGKVSLISDGSGDASIIGIDASGEDIFFETIDPLVPSDTDTQTDIYDARIGGGFQASTLAPACLGEACQGSLSAPPAIPPPGTATYSAPGNPKPRKHKTRRRHRHRRSPKHRQRTSASKSVGPPAEAHR